MSKDCSDQYENMKTVTVYNCVGFFKDLITELIF